MAFTTITVTIFLCMVAVIFAVIAGHYSKCNPNTGILKSLVTSAIVIPLIITIAAIPVYSRVTLDDWPNHSYALQPQFAVWVASMLGGFLGIKPGMVWSQGETSCFHCLLAFAGILIGLSLVIVLFL